MHVCHVAAVLVQIHAGRKYRPVLNWLLFSVGLCNLCIESSCRYQGKLKGKGFVRHSGRSDLDCVFICHLITDQKLMTSRGREVL